MLDFKMYTFLAVVESGSYTAAAQVLHLTQPAVTQHIQKLEEYYGCKLFTQEGRGMRLTAAGESFLHYTKMQQTNEEQLMKRLARIQSPLRIGSTLSIADYYLPSLLIPMLEEESYGFQVKVANTEVLLRDLSNGTLDGAFIEGMFDRGLFEAELFMEAAFIPVAAIHHPLANKKVTLTEIYEYPLILREKGSGTRAILESYLAFHNESIASFRRVREIGSFLLIKQFLESTQGISFMYEAVARKEIEEGRLTRLHIQDYRVTHPLQFVYLKNSLQEKTIREFFRFCLSNQM